MRSTTVHMGLLWWLSGKEHTCQCRRPGFDLWSRKISQRRKWQPTPVFLPGRSCNQRSLAGYSLCCAVLCLVAQLCLTLFDPMDCSCQAPLSMGFSRQEYWSGLPFLPPGDLPNPGIEIEAPTMSPALQVDSLSSAAAAK